MSPSERQQLKALFVATALYYDQRIPDEALSLYVEDLDDLSFPSVSQALKDLRRDPKTTRCPLPAMIRAKLTPESNPESEAMMIASRITGAVSKIGPYRAEDARQLIGPIGWQIVQSEGGWMQLCQQLTFDNSATLKAQWRNLAKVFIERQATPKLPQIEQKNEAPLSLVAGIFKEMPR